MIVRLAACRIDVYPQIESRNAGHFFVQGAGLSDFWGVSGVFQYDRRIVARRFKFHARQTRRYSPVTWRSPRRRNWRNPMTDWMMPNTGSTVGFLSA
jgi:hypothetical protein